MLLGSTLKSAEPEYLKILFARLSLTLDRCKSVFLRVKVRRLNWAILYRLSVSKSRCVCEMHMVHKQAVCGKISSHICSLILEYSAGSF